MGDAEGLLLELSMRGATSTISAAAIRPSPRCAICQTAIDLAHRFRSVAVAGGIENMADLQALQVMRCDYGQGILLAPPMPWFIELGNSRKNKSSMASPSLAIQRDRVA